ncbi:YggS family pyridoxal phosphate-dependent enzyme [Parabacteroides sp. OttesenSCG-928-G21]|nr:YggS family pyridoxal phosphate-dependent enzyme [Parabacteroides sp. OttesenSCG-928-G21]
MSVADNIHQLKSKLPAGVKLIAVSKFHPAETVMEAYDAGHRVFGESRAQELKAKQAILPTDIEWHFIGTLQRNKVKDIAAYIHTIHSVDSLKLLEEINKQAAKQGRIIRILLEVHIAQEASKQGLSPEECTDLLKDIRLSDYPNIKICGLMGMATDTDNRDLIRREFHLLRTLFDEIKQNFFPNDSSFSELSMGMSGDYPIAIEEGSTMIRVGTFIFGNRTY